MKTKRASLTQAAAVIALLLLAAPLTNAFSYQGVLSQNGSNAQGQFEMSFQLLESGTTIPVGIPVDQTVDVTDGLFQVDLAFDPLLFDGTPYDLQISVRIQGGPVHVLSPPTQLSATPQALFADSVGSVPDGALGGNVARLDQPAVFLTTVSMPQVRLSDATGGGRLLFGPTDDCTIGIDPNGASGLLLSDPGGVRVLSPDPAQSPRLIFGPTDECRLGIDPTGVDTGLVVYENFGFRIASSSPDGVSRLMFGPGPDDNCAIVVDPNPGGIRGMQILEEFGVRIRNPLPGGAARLSFGNDPDDLCVVSVEPSVAPGLLLRDPAGIRILSPDPTQSSSRLIFGPTDDCTIGIDPTGANTGLVVLEKFGFRIASAAPDGVSRLLFGSGADDNCAIVVDPDPTGIRGMQILEEFGVRIRNPLPGGAARLSFGNDPDDLCVVSVEPSVAPGLLLRDPAGIRILPPDSTQSSSRLIFGPTDDCTIGIDPTGANTGLVVLENFGFRIASAAPDGVSRLLFGSGADDNCAIIVDPDPTGIRGMQILEEFGVRIRNPQTGGSARLSFGDDPDDLCMVSVEPSVAPGLLLRDPAGIRILPVGQQSPPQLLFGPTDECRLGIDPSGAMRGLIAYEPNGVRLIDEVRGEPSLIFGPTDECRIRVAGDPVGGPPRLTLDDANGFLFTNNVEVQGEVHAAAFIQTSTRRLKENVQPIENPIELLQQLEGVRYDWKAEQGGQSDIGFIAEEVGKVFPEIVAWEEDGINARGLNYGHLVAVAVEGIKAQQAEIETLRQEKAEMETRLARLEALLLNDTQGK